jgi:hypothetical protein
MVPDFSVSDPGPDPDPDWIRIQSGLWIRIRNVIVVFIVLKKKSKFIV